MYQNFFVSIFVSKFFYIVAKWRTVLTTVSRTPLRNWKKNKLIIEFNIEINFFTLILFSWQEKEVWLIEQIRVSWNWNIETNSNTRNRPELSKNKALAGSKISNLRLKENSGKSFIELTFQSLRSRQCQQKLVKRIFNPFWNYDMNEIPWYRFWDCKNKATQTGNKRCSKTHIYENHRIYENILSKISILFEITFERIEARFSLNPGQYILSQS